MPFILSDKRDYKRSDNFYGVNGFFLRYESGKTFAVSHFFVFCPHGGRRHSVLNLAAIVVKRNVGIHKIQVLSSLDKAQGVFLAAGYFIHTVRMSGTL